VCAHVYIIHVLWLPLSVPVTTLGEAGDFRGFKNQTQHECECMMETTTSEGILHLFANILTPDNECHFECMIEGAHIMLILHVQL
jgi:hypothetical protein